MGIGACGEFPSRVRTRARTSRACARARGYFAADFRFCKKTLAALNQRFAKRISTAWISVLFRCVVSPSWWFCCLLQLVGLLCCWFAKAADFQKLLLHWGCWFPGSAVLCSPTGWLSVLFACVVSSKSLAGCLPQLAGLLCPPAGCFCERTISYLVKFATGY